ncbi:MAG: hypothetical protein AAGB16_08715, partial [Pseudomonadota bacterium]
MTRRQANRLSPLFSSWFSAADKWSGTNEMSSSEDRIRARAVFILGMLFVPLLTCLPILSSYANSMSPVTASLTMVSIIGMVIGLLVLNFMDNPSHAGITFCLSVSSAIVLWPGLSAGVFAPTHLLLALTPLLWGLMVGARACIIYSAILVCFVAGLTYFGPTAPQSVGANGSMSQSVFYGTMLIIATIVSSLGTAGYALLTKHMLGELEAKSEESATLAKEAEKARNDVTAASDRFQKFANIASDWLWETDIRGRITFFGGRNAAELKRPAEDIIGRHFMSVLRLRKHDMERMRAALLKTEAYCDIPA